MWFPLKHFPAFHNAVACPKSALDVCNFMAHNKNLYGEYGWDFYFWNTFALLIFGHITMFWISKWLKYLTCHQLTKPSHLFEHEDAVSRADELRQLSDASLVKVGP